MTVSAPRRVRSKEHLRAVAKQPCLVCGRSPSQAHHLKFLQPRALGRKLQVFTASNAMEIETAFSSLRERIGGLLVSGDPYFDGERDRLVSLAARYSVPTVYQWREFATIGGLMSYGTSILDAYRQAGTYVAKILNGGKPADLPVLQPTRLELVINLKTAAALGLTVPATLLASADEILE